MFEFLKECVLYLTINGSPDVIVSICSNGGSVDSGLDIYDLLKLYKGKKTAQVISMGGSMGAIIIQACDKRLCTPHAKILIHYISRRNISLDQLKNPEKLKEIVDDMEKAQCYLENILRKKTGKSAEEIQTQCAKDQPMSAQEALEFGLIDEIIDLEQVQAE